MWQYTAKVVITVAVIIAVTEIAKRSTFWGALLASLPLTSLLAFIWIYLGTGNSVNIANLSIGIFWLVLASLPLFLVLPYMLRSGIAFWPSFGVACAITVGSYFGLVWVLGRFGVHL